MSPTFGVHIPAEGGRDQFIHLVTDAIKASRYPISHGVYQVTIERAETQHPARWAAVEKIEAEAHAVNEDDSRVER